MRNRIDVLGVQIDSITKKELCRRTKSMLEGNGRGYIVTPNPEIVEFALRDRQYRDALNNASLCLADGVGVIYASRILGTPLPERLPGVEAAEMLLCLLSKRKKESVFLLGAEKGIADLAAESIQNKHGGIKISGTHHGFFDVSGEENEAVVKKINDSGAAVLFVCMGAPRQEKWIAANIDKLKNVKIAIALGGALDVYAGSVQRAPRMLREHGLEWAWRTVTIDGHFKKIGSLSSFAKHVILKRLKSKH